MNKGLNKLHKCFNPNQGKRYDKEFTKAHKFGRKKGCKITNGFKKGYVNPFKGKSRPEITGEKHFNWKGGISKNPYMPIFNLIKPQIRERDGHRCQLCHIYKNGIKLDVHHIDYNKSNNDKNNLISLCHKCNIGCNYNREHWTEYFKNKMDGLMK